MVKMTNAALAPIELKSGEDNDAADIVTKAIEDFTATVNERFAAIEKKFENDNSDALGSRLDKIEARLNRPGAPAIVTKKEDAAEIERKAFVDYARTGAVDTKALSVAANGAYLVPPVLLNELQKNLVLYSPIRSVARVTQIGVGTVDLPKRTANLSGAWVSETGNRTESAPTYDSQAFTAYEYATFVDVSLQLLEDSQFNLEQELMRDIAEEFGRAEGAAFVNGDGNGKPTGFLHSPAVGSIVDAFGATISPEDLIKLYHALPSFYAANAVWLMNRSTIGKIRAFKSTTGEFLWAPGTGENGLVPGNSGVLLGRPVIEVPDAPDVAPSTISVAFADMQAAYRIVDRISVGIMRDDFTQRTNGKVRFHARRRVGGDVAKTEAVRYLKTTA
jgi:HK97 family phage major capsid protein